MEDVSDPPFRAVCKDNGAHLMYTEFISSEGLIRDAIKSRKKLDIYDYEKPVGIQIFGGDEESLSLAAKIVDATNHDLFGYQFRLPGKKSGMPWSRCRCIERCSADDTFNRCCCEKYFATRYRKNKIGLG